MEIFTGRRTLLPEEAAVTYTPPRLGAAEARYWDIMYVALGSTWNFCPGWDIESSRISCSAPGPQLCRLLIDDTPRSPLRLRTRRTRYRPTIQSLLQRDISIEKGGILSYKRGRRDMENGDRASVPVYLFYLIDVLLNSAISLPSWQAICSV